MKVFVITGRTPWSGPSIFDMILFLRLVARSRRSDPRLGLLSLLLLQVLVAEIGDQTTDDDDSVDTDTSGGLVGLAGGRGSVGSGALGHRVSGLNVAISMVRFST